MVYWITGLSGAGKTTLGTLLYNKIKKQKDNVVLLDGDIMRDIFSDYDYTIEGRERLAMKYSKICKMLDDQSIDVVICTISMFENVRCWNRHNIRNYKEIFLQVTMEELMKRNKKGLYKKNKNGLVVGLDEKVEMPQNPDLVILNYGDVTPSEAMNLIEDAFNI